MSRQRLDSAISSRSLMTAHRQSAGLTSTSHSCLRPATPAAKPNKPCRKVVCPILPVLQIQRAIAQSASLRLSALPAALEEACGEVRS